MTAIGHEINVDDPLIFRGASKRYRPHFWSAPVASLTELNLEVRRGEILGLLGPNGAGKTTAIKLALGLIFPDAGEVLLSGVRSDRPAARSGVGYLPEVSNYPDDLTARELVEFAGTLYGVPSAERRRRADELLSRVGISYAADRALRKFSKGMLQRAGMARALVSRPGFVILDEPMSGLDPIGRREFRDLILGLRDDGTTVLFSSHVLSDAEMLCDRVAILKEGRLVGLKDVARLTQERRIVRWEVEVEGGQKIGGGEVISVRGASRLLRFSADWSAERILASVGAAGGKPLTLVPLRETLEDMVLATLEGAGLESARLEGTP